MGEGLITRWCVLIERANKGRKERLNGGHWPNHISKSLYELHDWNHNHSYINDSKNTAPAAKTDDVCAWMKIYWRGTSGALVLVTTMRQNVKHGFDFMFNLAERKVADLGDCHWSWKIPPESFLVVFHIYLFLVVWHFIRKSRLCVKLVHYEDKEQEGGRGNRKVTWPGRDSITLSIKTH